MRSTNHVSTTRLVFICIVFISVSQTCMGGDFLTSVFCSDQERLALLEFKRSVTDEQGVLSSWGVGNDCCRWERVGCDNATGRVVSLYLGTYVTEGYLVDQDEDLLLEDYDIVGDNEANLIANEVNSCLAELVYLEHLDLSGNFFSKSRIPEFFGSLKQLRYLNFSGAGFSGDIPHQIGNLTNLEVLDLSSYYIHYYTLPLIQDMSWISSLTKLKHLDLSGVDLRRAQNLENLLYKTPSLLKLRLSGCGLSTAQLNSHRLNFSGELVIIKHLDLSNNDFTSEIPGLLLNMTSLAFLDLSNNNLGMTQNFENLLNVIPFVSELHLSGCGFKKANFSPTKLNFSTHSNIQHLDLSLNEIEGQFPFVLTNMSSLLSLDLSENKLNSSIPFMPNLLKLDISHNGFRNIEDIGIWRQCNLKELVGSHNDLEDEMISVSTNLSKCSHNALESLYLGHNALKYSIPEAIGRLKNLRVLDLSFNELTGPIPEAVGNLRSLQGLDLSYNQLSGYIPESLGRLSSLTTMLLKANRFIGPVPVSLGGLTSVRVLSLSSNLLNGTIPDSIGHLTKLHLLNVSNNCLQGVVTEDHFSKLSMLKYLDATSNNKLVFNISREWIPPFQLKGVRLGSCKIEDGFPQWLRTQRKLEVLVLSNTSISGPLPKWLRLMPIIHVLDLSHNKLTGSLINLPSVNEVRYESEGILILQDNLFEGFIPTWLCTRGDLQVLDLSRNMLTGKIPECLWDTSLNVMLLGSNRLSGVIPSPLVPVSSNLAYLQLSNNNLNGELPRDGGYFTGLIILDLGENNFSGIIPDWIGENITNLSILRLHDNNFVGNIPHSLCKPQLLQLLDLAHNNLTGTIPHCFQELVAMKLANTFYNKFLEGTWVDFMTQVLKGVEFEYTKTLRFVRNMDLSSNKLVGEVPEALISLDALVGLNLSYNSLNGVIPYNIGSMKSLFSLDLSANELSGVIPQSMAALNFLSYLNLSHNNLSGQIPTGNQLRTLTDPSIYAYNSYLCGAPLGKECSPLKSTPTTPSKNEHENGNEPYTLWFYLDIMSGFATGFWGIIGVLLFKRQWRYKLFRFCEEIIDKIYNAIGVRVKKIKKGST